MINPDIRPISHDDIPYQFDTIRDYLYMVYSRKRHDFGSVSPKYLTSDEVTQYYDEIHLMLDQLHQYFSTSTK